MLVYVESEPDLWVSGKFASDFQALLELKVLPFFVPRRLLQGGRFDLKVKTCPAFIKPD